jgi:methyl-accepting chemotaxis protein
MAQTSTPSDGQRFERIEQAILQLADGQNTRFGTLTQLVNSQASFVDSQARLMESQTRLETIVEATRTEISQSITEISQSIAEISQSIGGINTTLSVVSETLASLQAASERHDRILDYLLRRDRDNSQ